MLTKGDLSDIRKVVQEEIKNETRPVRQDVQELRTSVDKDVRTLRTDFGQDIKTIKDDVAKIRQDMNMVLGFLDKEYIELRKRVERIEDHLGLPASQ